MNGIPIAVIVNDSLKCRQLWSASDAPSLEMILMMLGGKKKWKKMGTNTGFIHDNYFPGREIRIFLFLEPEYKKPQQKMREQKEV